MKLGIDTLIVSVLVVIALCFECCVSSATVCRLSV